MSEYVYGGSISYLDYLQAKSFAKDLNGQISAQTRKLIASVEQLQGAHISISKSLQRTVSAGFEQLSFDLTGVRQDLTELNSAFRWGIGEVLTAMGHVNDSLTELISLSKNPTKTWAYEQFETARDAYRKGLYDDALEHLGRAIRGHQGNPGYKLDYRFHFLLGTIRLGSFRNNAPDVVNLSAAVDAFLDAGKYAKMDNPREAGHAYFLAGRAAYCQGKMEASKVLTTDAVSLSPYLAEAHFQLAKVQMHLGKPDRAIPSLLESILLERSYSIKAAIDGDFKPHMAKVNDLLKELHAEAKANATALLSATERRVDEALAMKRDFNEALAEFKVLPDGDFAPATNALRDAKIAVTSDTYYGLLDGLSLCRPVKDSLGVAIDQFVISARRGIQERLAANVRVKTDYSGGGPFAGLGAVVLGLIAMTASGFWNGVGFGVVVGWPVTYVISSIVVFFMGRNENDNRDRNRTRLQQIDSKLQRVQTPKAATARAK